MSYNLKEVIFKLAGVKLSEGKERFEFDDTYQKVSFKDSATDDIKNTNLSEIERIESQSHNTTTNFAADASIPAASKTKPKKLKKKKNKDAFGTRAIHWGSVEVISFPRTVGYHCVPNKGLHPLGLCMDAVSKESLTIDEYQLNYDSDLLARSNNLFIKSKARKSFDITSETLHVDKKFETRQFDYKSGSINPLFQATIEEERIILLGNIRERSGSFSELVPPEISDSNREIKSIRSSRDNTGCSCRPVKLDKLSVSKMKSELFIHGHSVGITDKDEIEKLSKADLTSKLRDALKFCELCVTNNCECVQYGIPCSAETCGCLRGAHHQGQKLACHNSYGQLIFNPDEVKTYRQKILAGNNNHT